MIFKKIRNLRIDGRKLAKSIFSLKKLNTKGYNYNY